MAIATRSTGRSRARVEGRAKVTGEARYAFEHDPGEAAYAAIVSATIPRGVIAGLDETGVHRIPGVLTVLWCGNAERLHEAPGELAVLQSRRVAYRGQIAAAVVADTPETARHAAELVRIEYQLETPDTMLTADHRGLYRPEKVNAGYETDTAAGDVDAALEAAPVGVDSTYETPAFHNNPMEPHATVAAWEPDGTLTLYDSTQSSSGTARTIAAAFGLDPAQVRVVNHHVGGGFGSKGTPRPHVVLAAMAARAVGRPVKLAVTRQQMFPLTGYRTPTIQRVRLGSGPDGRLTAIAHDVIEQTSTVAEFAEQTAVVTRMMYAAPNRRTTHRVVALDVPTPSWMRAPGECPGMYALESALDELAVTCGIDPIELRLANEPEVDPESGHPFSSRGLVACLREGASRFGWAGRDPAAGVRRDGRWLVGTGVAASTYPARRRPSHARVHREAGGRFRVAVAANDIGTGARTVLQQIAADALETDPDRVQIAIGDSSLPYAPVAGGSMGTASWGSAIVKACRILLERPGDDAAEADTTADIERDEPLARHAFGAQFVEARVNTVTGEIRVPRMTGVFAAGAILNPAMARSQFAGGMTMGLGMALLEESVLDPHLGAYVNHDLATYHVPTYADVGELDISWLEEEDPHLNPMGSKGIGEIGIVGTAAAVANAVHHATGHRFRRLPIGIADVLRALGGGA
jgi:xanthine dehydrogenase YagR molybdenum-binding subunit